MGKSGSFALGATPHHENKGYDSSDDEKEEKKVEKLEVEDELRIFETPSERRKRRLSLLVIYITAFSFSLGFSIVLTGVFPYLLQLDGNDPSFTDPKVFFGWVVAAFPLGQLIASPLAGLVGKKLGSVRIPLLFTLLCFSVGMVFYAMLGALPAPRRYWMLGSRFITGMAAATVALSLSYASQATTEAERTTGISIVNFAQSVGFIIGPAIQSALAGIGCEGTYMGIEGLYFNMYTASAWIAAIIGFLNMILLLPGIFTEFDMAAKERELMKAKAKEAANDDDSYKKIKPDKIAIAACLITFGIVIFSFIFTETLATPMAIDNFAWTEEEAVSKVGIMLTIGGVISAVCFLTAGILARKIGERNVMLFLGFIPLIAAGLTYFPYAGEPPKPRGNSTYLTTEPPMTTLATALVTGDFAQLLNVSLKDVEVIEAPHRQWVEHRGNDIPTMLLLYSESHAFPEFFELRSSAGGSCGSNETGASPGCPYDEQPWCATTPAVKIEQFYAGYAFTSIGYPFGLAMINSLYAKVLGPVSQHVWMGFLAAAGAFSRVLGPILVSYLYTYAGSQYTFGALTGLMAVNFLGLLLIYKRLVPLSAGVMKSGDKS